MPDVRRLAPAATRRPLTPDSDGSGRHAPAAEALAPDDVRAVLHALRAVGRELRLAERSAEQALGIHPAQLHMLHELEDGPAASLAELAERTHTDPSSASVVVQRLVERRLVARTEAPGDRRRTEIALTAAGRALLARAPASARARFADALGTLGDRQARALARGLAALARALRDAGGDGRVE
jgi:DNA-binding MarR family transcriptional regulator